MERLLAAIGLMFLVYFSCFDLSYMVTSSMAPTLEAGEKERADWVLTERISLWFSNPRRWEVVTFRDREGNQLMKRVVGLPAETVSLPDVGRLEINGGWVEPPGHLAFLQYLPAGNLARGASVPVREGWYVLGDHVRDSLDSRFDGPVPRQRMLGRAWLRVWPLSRFGLIR